jgi:thymidine kinase
MVERRPEVEKSPKQGSIEVISGCMFSGKTDELIRRLKTEDRSLKIRVRSGYIAPEKAGDYIRVFKASKDKRYDPNSVASHSGSSYDAEPINEKQPDVILELISENTKVVGIDEAQFFSEGLVGVCHELADRGVRVIVAGLDTNFRGETYGIMGDLIPQADVTDQEYAVCMVCGDKQATRTQRVIIEDIPDGEEVRRPASYDDPITLVGASDFYEARCREHHEVPGKPSKDLSETVDS